jgi:hypothetical protein
MLPNQRDPFTQRNELKAHQLGLVTVVDVVNARSMIRSGGSFTRDVRQAKPFHQSKYGRRIPFASHKLEAPLEKR